MREKDVYYAIARPKRQIECFLRLVHFWRPGLQNGRDYRPLCDDVARKWRAEQPR